MSRWNTPGLRGSTLEELINMTNDNYRAKNLALVLKLPTPITPVKIDGENRTITLAYFDQKSAVDYIGAARGVPICFDAKETARAHLPVQNIHPHQIAFMRDFDRQGGLSFLITHFSAQDEYFLLPFNVLAEYWAAAEKGGRKSIPYESFDKSLQIFSKSGFYLHYLEAVDTYLKMKNT